MRKDSCLIPDDGYTEMAYIEAKLGMHGEFRFEYRPLLVEQRSLALRTMNELKDEEQDVVVAKKLASQLTSWSIDKPVAYETVRRLHPAIFYRVWGIVLGTSASDLDPKWLDEKKKRDTELLVESAAVAAPVGVVREAHDEKNSGAG